MTSSSPGESSMALVHEGWDHLRAQRPLAAWASWRRALCLDPESAAAAQALATLASAPDLPASARAVYRLRGPASAARRAAWDDRLGDRGAEDWDLMALADGFGRLASQEPDEPAAWYNRALCLAWMGNNREAVDCLERVVALEAEQAFDRAVEAWTLAEVLRQGGGAEGLADDLRYAWTLDWEPRETAWLLEEFPEIQPLPTPQAPGAEAVASREVEVFQWLDRCPPAPGGAPRASQGGDLPVVLASVYHSPASRSLRLSSPRVETLRRVEELLLPRLEGDAGRRSLRREASPLPLAFLDADVWTVRIPTGVEPAGADHLVRDWIEHFYEDEWIHRERQGLAGLSPMSAADEARRGHRVVRARLAAVVGFREQLGRRPSAARLYQGYPFDRLRRRLGLEPIDPTAVDPQDLTCAGPGELDRLDVAALDDAHLIEAVASAAGLRDDARTARLAAELVRRRPLPAGGIDLAAMVVAPLVRQAMSRGDCDAALGWIDRVRPAADASTAATLDIWHAEILARIGRADAAMHLYRSLIRPDTAGAALALDAAETLLDNGHLDQARSLLATARDLARATGRRGIERRAREFLA
jgi:tetratricopeptide (TPR) repeat protein